MQAILCTREKSQNVLLCQVFKCPLIIPRIKRKALKFILSKNKFTTNLYFL
jgi:hypothetical protein